MSEVTKNEKKNRLCMQVSISEELMDENGGIGEVLKHGVNSRYRDCECEVEESVLCSWSRFLKEGYYRKHFENWREVMTAGFYIGIDDQIWYNVEFECRIEDAKLELGEEQEDLDYCGFYVKEVRPEWMTAVYKIEMRDEEPHILETIVCKGGEECE